MCQGPSRLPEPLLQRQLVHSVTKGVTPSMKITGMSYRKRRRSSGSVETSNARSSNDAALLDLRTPPRLVAQRAMGFRVDLDMHDEEELSRDAGLSWRFLDDAAQGLVVYLGNRRASGTLKPGARRRPQAGALAEQARVVSASSNQPREYLGQILINMGHVTEEQFNQGLRDQSTERLAGESSMEDGAWPRRDATARPLRMRFRETLLDAFQWTEGTFQFHPSPRRSSAGRAAPSSRPPGYPSEGEFRETAWKRCGPSLLSVNGAARADPASGLHRTFSPRDPRGAVVASFSRGRPSTRWCSRSARRNSSCISGCMPSTGRTSFGSGMSEGAPRPSKRSPLRANLFRPRSCSIARGIARARGDPVKRRLWQSAPSSYRGPRVEGVFQDLQTALLQLLGNQLLRVGVVPQLNVSSDEIRRLQLSAAERYLLSRVDGKRELRAIVRVSPLHQEIDTGSRRSTGW